MTHIVSNRPDMVYVEWEITTTCNYECWYCPPNLHDGKSRWPDPEIAANFITKLAAEKPVLLSFLGGEPTLWPGLLDFAERIPKDVLLEVSTNGSRTLRWWEKAAPRFEQVIVTFHPNTADVDHTVALMKLLDPIVPYTVVHIMFDPQQKEKIAELHSALMEAKINHGAKIIRPQFGERLPYTDNEMELIRTTRFSKGRPANRDKIQSQLLVDGVPTDPKMFVLDGKNRFKGWRCMVGHSRLFIKANGDIYGAGCMQHKLGNMATEWQRPEQGVICPVRACECLADVFIEKWSPE